MAKRRPSRDGMVRKREDGRWEGRIVVGHKEDGAPHPRHAPPVPAGCRGRTRHPPQPHSRGRAAKGRARNVYAKTRAESEEKLDALIREMQAERKLLQDRTRGITPPMKLTQKQQQIWEYMKFHPKEANLSAIARGAGVHRHTVAKHYEMIRGMVGFG